MSVPTAQGYPQYGQGGVSQFIPTLFARKLVPKYYAASHMAAVSNTNYEGDIKNQGDKVVIRSRPTIATFEHIKGKDIDYGTAPEAPPVELLIDKGEGYAFPLDAVDEKQADIQLSDEFLIDAANQMRTKIETKTFLGVVGQAAAANVGITAGAKSQGYNLGSLAAPVGLTKANIIDYLTSLRSVLGEQNADQQGKMWVILPYLFRHLLVNSDLKNASLTGDGQSVIRNGRIGSLDDMEIYVSNLLPGGTSTDGNSRACTYVMAGNRDAITFATQFVRNESLPNPNQFGMLFRGLQVYGYKVVKPEGLSVLTAYKGT